MSFHKKRRRSETSSFGVSARVNHDSSKFYRSKLYDYDNSKKNVRYIENEISIENM